MCVCGCRTLSEASRPVNLFGSAVAQHPTHHVSVLFVPDVVTNRAPATLVENLHATFMRPRAVHQTHQSLLHCNTHQNTHIKKMSVYKLTNVRIIRLIRLSANKRRWAAAVDARWQDSFFFKPLRSSLFPEAEAAVLCSFCVRLNSTPNLDFWCGTRQKKKKVSINF